MLTNPRAERVKRVAALSGRFARAKHSQLLVEGPQAVRSLVQYRAAAVRDVYVTEAAAARHPEVVEEAQRATRYVHWVSEDVARTLSSQAQGLVAVAHSSAIVGAADQTDLFVGARLVVILARAADPGNMGTIIRIADACGADAVVVAAGGVEVGNPKVIRSSAGSVFHLPVLEGQEFAECVAAGRAAGMQVLAADGYGHITLESLAAGTGPYRLAAPTLWVLGNEAHGLSDAERAACDETVAITLWGRAESLNVAAAAAIVLHATARAQHG